jgi:hypothetical protein
LSDAPDAELGRFAFEGGGDVDDLTFSAARTPSIACHIAEV